MKRVDCSLATAQRRIICVINQAWSPGAAEGGGSEGDTRAEARAAVVWQRCCASRPHSAELWSTPTGESEGAPHGQRAPDTVKTFSFTRDLCHFLSTEVPSTHPHSDKRTCKQAVCQFTLLKKDLPLKHFMIFVPLYLSWRGNFISTLDSVFWLARHWTMWMSGMCLVWSFDTLTMCLSIRSSDHWSLWVVPHAPEGSSVDVRVRRPCWAHYRPLLTDTLKGLLDRCRFIKSSAHSNGCCYLCMFVSIRLLPPHFLTEGYGSSISPLDSEHSLHFAALALL